MDNYKKLLPETLEIIAKCNKCYSLSLEDKDNLDWGDVCKTCLFKMRFQNRKQLI